MNEPLHFDLVAIGGGFAGLCAAVRGAELGLRTAVLEAGADEGYLCSSRWAGGIFHVSYHDVKLSPDELARRDQPPDRRRGGSGTGGGDCRRCRPHRRLAREPGRRVHAGEPDRLAPLHVGAAARAVAGQDWQGRGPDRLLGELRRRLQERQGRLLLGTRAASLRMERGRVVGVMAHKDGACSISAPTRS